VVIGRATLSAMIRGLLARILSPAGLVFVLAIAPASAQTSRTPDGQPDLQGMWVNNTATPLERPRDMANREFFTTAEAAAYEARYQLDRTAALSHVDPAFELEVAGDLDTYEPGRILPSLRASLITDPADGRVPPLTPAAQQALAERNDHFRVHYADHPEDFTNAERCLIVGNASTPPMLPVFYNNLVQIVQTRDHVMIVSEMIHDVRVIPLDGRPHLPPDVTQWKGDARGHWDGDTLVVETTNFSDKTTVRGSGRSLRIIERFSLSDTRTLRYQFRVEDPAAFVRPWSGESAMFRTDEQMYEYACHEGNDSLTYLLRGYRFAEREAEKF
jgi:hypothetical protein